jgi:hypothetical protein
MNPNAFVGWMIWTSMMLAANTFPTGAEAKFSLVTPEIGSGQWARFVFSG